MSLASERVSHVLFDFDGVICDTEPLGIAGLARALAHRGIDVPEEDLVALVGVDALGIDRWLAERGFGITFEQILATDDPHTGIYLSGNLEAMPGAMAFIHSLRAAGISTALVSSTESRLILSALDQLGLMDAFDSVVCGDMVERCKPDPCCYEHTLANLGVEPANCIALEDSLVGIRAAKAAGIFVVGFEGSVIDQDTSEADVTLASFEGATLETILDSRILAQ